MPITQPVVAFRFSGNRIMPVDTWETTIERNVNLAPSTAFLAGTVLGLVSAAANDIQTLTVTGTPTGGTLAVTGTHPTSGGPITVTLAFNSTVAQTQTAMDAALRGRYLTVSGGTLPGATQIFTAVNAAVSLPIPLMVASGALLTGGTAPAAAIVHTTIGAMPRTYAAYSGAVVAPPAAPTVGVGTLTTDAPAAASYSITVTFYNAQGETTASTPTVVVADGTHEPSISSIAIPSGVTGIRYYVGNLKFSQVTSAGVVVLTATNLAAAAGAAPTTNTAYTAASGAGTQVGIAILPVHCSTDAAGNIYVGSHTVGGASQWGQSSLVTDIYTSGDFLTKQLVGVDTNLTTSLGWQLLDGTIADGIIRKF